MSEKNKTSNADDSTRSVFVISPIGAAGTPESIKAQAVLDYIIRQALTLPTWKVIRADEEADSGSITHKVIERIATSDLIVADLTDHNPNVFYELAVAHGYDKPVVNLMTDGQRMPFDIVDQRAVFYDLTDPGSVHRAKLRLAKAAESALSPESKITNPLAGYRLFAASPNEAEEGAPNGAKLEYALDTIMARLGRIESEILGDANTGIRTNTVNFGSALDLARVGRPSPAMARRDVAKLQSIRRKLAQELEALKDSEHPTDEQKVEMEMLASAIMDATEEIARMKGRSL